MDVEDDDAETFSEEKKEVNFSPTRLAPVSRDDQAAFAPSRSCSPVRSIFHSMCVCSTPAEQLYSPVPRPICRLSFYASPFENTFSFMISFPTFLFLFHLEGTVLGNIRRRWAKNERRDQLLQPRPRRIPKKKGARCDPNTSSSSLCTLVLISCKMWRRGARSVGMAGGMGRSLPARSALLQSNTATTLTSTSVPLLILQIAIRVPSFFLSIYL